MYNPGLNLFDSYDRCLISQWPGFCQLCDQSHKSSSNFHTCCHCTNVDVGRGFYSPYFSYLAYKEEAHSEKRGSSRGMTASWPHLHTPQRLKEFLLQNECVTWPDWLALEIHIWTDGKSHTPTDWCWTNSWWRVCQFILLVKIVEEV